MLILTKIIPDKHLHQSTLSDKTIFIYFFKASMYTWVVRKYHLKSFQVACEEKQTGNLASISILNQIFICHFTLNIHVFLSIHKRFSTCSKSRENWLRPFMEWK